MECGHGFPGSKNDAQLLVPEYLTKLPAIGLSQGIFTYKFLPNMMGEVASPNLYEIQLWLCIPVKPPKNFLVIYYSDDTPSSVFRMRPIKNQWYTPVEDEHEMYKEFLDELKAEKSFSEDTPSSGSIK